MSAKKSDNGICLTPDQQEAFDLICEWYLNLTNQIFVLCGYAGTGKTFLIDYAVKQLGLVPGESAVFLAPTGKAASVLIRNGTTASTIHSLIYVKEEDIEVDENGEVISEQFLRFIKRESIASQIRLIVVDETSMVDNTVLRDLLSYGVKCLFCGDPAQLRPVNGTNSLLTMPCITLKSIVRQEADNPIVYLASRVREGLRIGYGDYGAAAVVSRRELTPELRRRLFLKADQIIVGSNRTRNAVNSEIRGYLGIPPDRLLPTEGEKIICTLNNWSKPLDEAENFHLVNGIIGTCLRVSDEGEGLGMLDFKPDFLPDTVGGLVFDAGIFLRGKYDHLMGTKAYVLENGSVVPEGDRGLSRKWKVKREETVCRFEFAYAITCHKSQGSEYDFVVVIDESRFFNDGGEWLYTAITRAKKKLLIIR